MVESDMQTMFKKHLLKNPPVLPEVYELKICKLKSIPFDALQPHQEKSLLAVLTTGFFHKITDPPVYSNMKTRFNVPRPFDCMFLQNIAAYVIIWFYKPRQQKIFIKIPIESFIQERADSLLREKPRKSLTEQRALEIGQAFVINIKD